MNSLQEQLLKARLTDEKKVKQANKQKRKQKKQARSGVDVAVDDTREAAQQALAEKARRSRELARQQNARAEQRAIAAQVKQLIDINKQSRQGGEVAYNFTDGKHIKKLFVTEAIQDALVKGRLAIVRFGEGYELVPAPIAEKISQRDADSVLLLNDPASDEVDEDDPYAEYKIPDDLMW